MFQSIFIIARRILRDAIRNRLLLIGLVFTLIISGFAAMAAAVSMGEHTRLVVDVGLSATSFFGTMTGIALAVGSVGLALRNKGLYPMLVRPISRFELLTGIFFGQWFTIIAIGIIFYVSTAGAVTLLGGSLPSAFLYAFVSTLVELGVVVAVSIAMSTLGAPAAAATYSAFLVFTGHFTIQIDNLVQTWRAEEITLPADLLDGFSRILPDMERLSFRHEAANHLDVAMTDFSWSIIYGLLYIASMLLLASFTLETKRNI